MTKIALIIGLFIIVKEDVLHLELMRLDNLKIRYFHSSHECVVCFTPSRFHIPQNLKTSSIFINPVILLQLWDFLMIFFSITKEVYHVSSIWIKSITSLEIVCFHINSFFKLIFITLINSTFFSWLWWLKLGPSILNTNWNRIFTILCCDSLLSTFGINPRLEEEVTIYRINTF